MVGTLVELTLCLQASQLPGLGALLEMCPKFQEQKRESFCRSQGVIGVLCTFELGLMRRIKFSRERVVSIRDCHVQIGVLGLIAQHTRYPGFSRAGRPQRARRRRALPSRLTELEAGALH